MGQSSEEEDVTRDKALFEEPVALRAVWCRAGTPSPQLPVLLDATGPAPTSTLRWVHRWLKCLMFIRARGMVFWVLYKLLLTF